MGKPNVFISYSHKDKKWKDRLVTQLRVLEDQGLLELWDDRRISVGEEWFTEILKAIDDGSIAVLLVSANSLTSDFILREEVPRLLQRRDNVGMRIFPVIITPCDWEAVSWLRRMQLRPRDGKPLSRGRKPQIDAELADIVREIRLLLESPSSPDNLKSQLKKESPANQNQSRGKDEMRPWSRIFADILLAGVRRISFKILIPVICSILFIPSIVRNAISFYIDHFTPDGEAQDYIDRDSNRKWNPKKEICGDQLRGICFTDDQVVLFKDTVKKRGFNYYRDFLMVFDLRFTNGKGGAWVVRAQDYKNYYLFVWSPAIPPEESSNLALYIYENGEPKFVKSVMVPLKIDQPDDSFQITLVAQDYQFTHTIKSLKSDKQVAETTGLLEDSVKNYSSGGIGFRALNGSQMLLQYFAVEPR